MLELEGLPLASFRARALACALDGLSVILLLLLVLAIRSLFTGRQSFSIHIGGDEGEGLWEEYGVKLIVPFCYWGIVTWLTNGKTLGKWIDGIRVVSTTHERIRLWQSAERALGYSISSLESGFGFLQYFITPNRRTTHDRIAETVVVRDRPLRKRLRKREMEFPQTTGVPSLERMQQAESAIAPLNTAEELAGSTEDASVQNVPISEAPMPGEAPESALSRV